MLACKYHSFPIYFSFEFNVVSIERKNFPIEVKLVNASMYQKRPFLTLENQTVQKQQNFNKTFPETYLKNKVSILAPFLAFKT